MKYEDQIKIAKENFNVEIEPKDEVEKKIQDENNKFYEFLERIKLENFRNPNKLSILENFLEKNGFDAHKMRKISLTDQVNKFIFIVIIVF